MSLIMHHLYLVGIPYEYRISNIESKIKKEKCTNKVVETMMAFNKPQFKII